MGDAPIASRNVRCGVHNHVIGNAVYNRFMSSDASKDLSRRFPIIRHLPVSFQKRLSGKPYLAMSVCFTVVFLSQAS